MRTLFAARTDVGRVREGNEDAYFTEDPLFIVADGMGGHLAGDVASATAVDTIVEQWRKDGNTGALAAIVRNANETIWQKSRADPRYSGMGTTCTLVVVDGDRAHLAHVGDSRAYLLRDGELSQLTEDHTVVGRMVREGRIRAEEAEHHPNRNIITRALGVDPEVQVDQITLDLQAGDRVMLCSDGLTSMVGSDVIRDVLVAEQDREVAADRLIELANRAGGEDNITVVLLDVVEDDDHQQAAAWADTQTQQVTDPGGPPPSLPSAWGYAGEQHLTETSPRETPGDGMAEPAGAAETRPRRWLRALVIGVLALAIIGILAFAGVRFALSNSWFVGADDDGYITIYRGVPDNVAGLELKDAVDRSSVRVEDLPEFLRSDVSRGVSVDSQGEAQETVANLERQARDPELKQARPTTRDRT